MFMEKNGTTHAIINPFHCRNVVEMHLEVILSWSSLVNMTSSRQECSSLLKLELTAKSYRKKLKLTAIHKCQLQPWLPQLKIKDRKNNLLDESREKLFLKVKVKPV